MDDARVGHLRIPWRVPNRGVATARVPAQEAALAERHARKDVESSSEMHMFRKRGDDLGPAVLVDDSLHAEKACVRLTVFAVADRSRGASRRLEVAAKLAAATLKRMVHGASRNFTERDKRYTRHGSLRSESPPNRHRCNTNFVRLVLRARSKVSCGAKARQRVGIPRASRFRYAPHLPRYR